MSLSIHSHCRQEFIEKIKYQFYFDSLVGGTLVKKLTFKNALLIKYLNLNNIKNNNYIELSNLRGHCR